MRRARRGPLRADMCWRRSRGGGCLAWLFTRTVAARHCASHSTGNTCGEGRIEDHSHSHGSNRRSRRHGCGDRPWSPRSVTSRTSTGWGATTWPGELAMPPTPRSRPRATTSASSSGGSLSCCASSWPSWQPQPREPDRRNVLSAATSRTTMYLAEGRRRGLVPGRAVIVVPAHLTAKWIRNLDRQPGRSAKVGGEQVFMVPRHLRRSPQANANFPAYVE